MIFILAGIHIIIAHIVSLYLLWRYDVWYVADCVYDNIAAEASATAL